MKVIFMGTPDFSVPILQALAEQHRVLAVYCQPPRPAGRGQRERPSPVQLAAEILGLAVRHPSSLRAPDVQSEFAAFGADIAVVVAYGLILPQPVLDAPRLGCLNIHASLLPRWRGAAPIHRAILSGDAETGVSIMQMDAGLDTGPVLMREATRIGPEETSGELHDRLSQIGARLILKAIESLPGHPSQPQPASGITYAAKIDKSEARIDWSMSAVEVDRRIRGMSPFPGAWCDISDERVKLLRSRMTAGCGEPGQVLHGLTIACGTGAVEIIRAQREGKRPSDAEEFLRGFNLPARLG